MFGRLVRGGLSALKWALCATGVLALAVLAMLAWPLQRPPELQSILETVRTVDRSTMPSADVKLIDGVNHLAIVSAPNAISAIAEDVATRGTPGSGS